MRKGSIITAIKFVATSAKKKYVFLLAIFSLFFSNQMFSHSVQVAYCVSCTGNLTLYVEHWHGSEDPTTTTMTITTNIDGVISTQTGIPVGSIQNTTFNDLPNCATNKSVFASCSRANSENDWVIYDFPAATPGSIVDMTVVSGNNDFTRACESMYPASSGSFVVPTITAPPTVPDFSMCGGVASNEVVVPVVPAFTSTWTNDNPAIGLAASGTGNVPSFIPPIVTSPQVANITIDHGCFQDVFQITILPAPDPLELVGSIAVSGTECVYDSLSIDANGATMVAPATIISYDWDFGDGTTSTEVDNKHIYATPGDYNITLSILGSNGCINNSSTIYTAYPKPVADFSASAVCEGAGTVFNGGLSTVNAPSSIANQIWEYGDGGASVTTDPTYTYATSGDYTAQLIAITDHGCRDTVSKPLTVFANPIVNAAVSDACVYDSLGFSSAGTTILAPATISSYNWDFGDATNSSAENPNHKYTSEGTYNVTFTATSADGCTDQTTIPATAFPTPAALYTFENKCTYDDVPFDATTSNIASGAITGYDWDFGDGSTGSSVNVANLYGSEGTYDVRLIVSSDNNCKDTINQTITVFPVPTASFTNNNVCFNTAVDFSSASSSIGNPGTIDTYSWDFGNGSASTDPNPSHLYATAGSYNVGLTITSGDGCINQITRVATTHPKPDAAFTFLDRCANATFTFDASTSAISNGGTIADYAWKYGDGGTGNGQTSTNLYGTGGVYTVELITTSDNNCLDTATASATAFPIPVASFSSTNECLNVPIDFDASASNVNAPATITDYGWTFDGTAQSTVAPTNQFTFAAAGSFLVELTVTTDNSCTNQTSSTVTVHPLPSPMFNFENTCEETPVPFTNTSTIPAGSITGYSWDFGDTNTSSSTSPQNTFSTASTYNVKLVATSNNNCIDSITQAIVVNPRPVADFENGDTESCSPLCIDFTDLSVANSTSMSKYSWTFDNGETSTSQNTSLCFENDDNEVDDIFDLQSRLIVTNDFGCVDSSSKTIPVSVFHHPLSSFVPTPEETDMHNAEIQLQNYSLGTDNYLWLLGDGDSSDVFEVQHHYNDTGTFTVKLYNSTINGCVDSSENTVRINPVVHITIPNAFTPNGDGINDFFSWKGYGIEKDNYEFNIYNRWGERIFRSNDFTPWDGFIGSNPAQEDVYVYKVYYMDVFQEEHTLVGTVTLIR